MRRIINLVEAAQTRLYHVSNNPDLNVSKNHELGQGQMGRGFYLTAQPRAWADTLERKYLYRVQNPEVLKIATDKPSTKEFTEWAISVGFMEMAPVVKPDGTIVLDLKDKPLIRPRVTERGEKLLWSDPMTGKSMNDLENEYLRQHGYNAYEARYSPEGHQLIVFDPQCLTLKRIRWGQSSI